MAEITHLDSRRGGNAVTPVQRADDTVHCLQIPLHGELILLPNAAVAEVTGYVRPEPLPDAPDWYLGKIEWRERKVPLVSFEIASGGGAVSGGTGARIAVLNTLNANPRVPYIAIVTQGIPSLKLVRERQITNDDVMPRRPSVASVVKLDGNSLLIPDIDDLEKRIERLQVV